MTREEYRQALTPYLPPPILERAVANYDPPRFLRRAPDRGQRDLIADGFVWFRTPEGVSFWGNVDLFMIGESETLPPLPT